MYNKLKGVSDKLIRQFGQACEVHITETGKYNPATGERRKGSTTINNGYCLFDNLAFDFNSSRHDSAQGSASMVEQGDVLIYLTASCQPVLNAQVVVGGERWSIVNVQPINPGGTAIIYQAQGRRAYG